MKALPILLALAGCTGVAALVQPELAQLAHFQSAPPEVVALEEVRQPCPAENPACPRLHQLRAEACLALAFRARAPGAACPGDSAATRRLLDCAAQSYAAALPGAEAAHRPALAAAQAEAVLCRADLEGADLPLLLPAAAAAADAAGATLLRARAALLVARLGPASTRCDAARRALALAQGGAGEALQRANAEAATRVHACEATP